MGKNATGPRGLNLGRDDGSGRSKEHPLIAVLAVIILGALVVTVMYNWSSDEEDEDSVETRMMCKCLMPDCGAEFVYDEQVERTLKATGAAPAIRMPMYGCPKCKKAYCALVMRQCPKCKKHYLSATVLHAYKVEVLAARGRDPSVLGKAPPTVCPYCKTDFNAWHRENRPKGGRR